MSFRKNGMRKTGDYIIAISRILAVNGRIEIMLFIESELDPRERITYIYMLYCYCA